VQQSVVGRVEEATAAGGSEVKEDLSNVQGELTMMKEEIRRLKMITARQFFPPSMKEGKLRLGGGKETETICDIPDGIIVHLTKECGGNVHDAKVVDVTCGSFEMETVGVNPHSGAFKNDPDFVATRHQGNIRERFALPPVARNTKAVALSSPSRNGERDEGLSDLGRFRFNAINCYSETILGDPIGSLCMTELDPSCGAKSFFRCGHNEYQHLNVRSMDRNSLAARAERSVLTT
jgi:hypothetical protein